MPDKWEYPWFAAWDLAFHCAALALVDVDFAKDQIELMLKETYLHPNGQIPAYEWAFGDVNPAGPRRGRAEVFPRRARAARARAIATSCKRVFHKLLLNYAWWINRKDADGHNVFEGGFLGLDNISVFDRSQPLPPGFSLKQADATGWMAMFALNMTVMALELAVEDPGLRGHRHSVLRAVPGHRQRHRRSRQRRRLAMGSRGRLLQGPPGHAPDGGQHRIDVYSWVGLIPLFACRGRRPAAARQRTALRGPAERPQGRLFSGQLCVRTARTGRTSAASTCCRWSTTPCCRASLSGC